MRKTVLLIALLLIAGSSSSSWVWTFSDICPSYAHPFDCPEMVQADYHLYARSMDDNVQFTKAVAWWWSTFKSSGDIVPHQCGSSGHPTKYCDSPGIDAAFGSRDCQQDDLILSCAGGGGTAGNYPFIEYLTGTGHDGFVVHSSGKGSCTDAGGIYDGYVLSCTSPLVFNGQSMTAGPARTYVMRQKHNGGVAWANILYQMEPHDYLPDTTLEQCRSKVKISIYRQVDNGSFELISEKEQWTVCQVPLGDYQDHRRVIGQQSLFLLPPFTTGSDTVRHSVAYKVKVTALDGNIKPGSLQAMFRHFPAQQDWARNSFENVYTGFSSWKTLASVSVSLSQSGHIFAFGELDRVDQQFFNEYIKLNTHVELRFEFQGSPTTSFWFDSQSSGGRPLYLWVFEELPPGTYNIKLQAKRPPAITPRIENNPDYMTGELLAFSVRGDEVQLQRSFSEPSSEVGSSWKSLAKKINGYMSPATSLQDYSNLGMAEFVPNDDRELVWLTMGRIPRDAYGNALTGLSWTGAPGGNDWGQQMMEILNSKNYATSLAIITE